jgi:hypothetical protein
MEPTTSVTQQFTALFPLQAGDFGGELPIDYAMLVSLVSFDLFVKLTNNSDCRMLQ